MIATTSKLAYKTISENGVTGKQKKLIYSTVKSKSKSLSLREISALTGLDINAVSGRVNTLKKEGHLYTTDKRKCEITNMLITPVSAR